MNSITKSQPDQASSRLSRLPVKIQRQSNRGQSLNRQKQSLDRNIVRSKSTLGEQSRLSRQRSSSILRQTTPLSHNVPRSTRKSPLASSSKKDVRPISDKRWQYDQLVKIKNFVASYVPHVDHNTIKSGMSLDTFIFLTGTLFQMIDRRLEITRDNYIEEIPSILKLFNYPIIIKPSLMKSVNTSHSWPSVVAIFSWLIDILYKIHIREEPEDLSTIIDHCILQLFCHKINPAANTPCESLKELDRKLVELYDIDEESLDKEKNELKRLEQLLQEYEEKNTKNKEEIGEITKKTDSLNSKCDQYTTENEEYEAAIIEKLHIIHKNIEKSDEELQNLYLNEKTLKATIAKQIHSVNEYQLLISEIEALKNTVKLKEERCQQQSEFIHKLDHEVSDLRQNLEADAYSYNNIISQMELFDCDLKELHIRESRFTERHTKDELHKVEQLLKSSIEKLKSDINASQALLQQCRNKFKLISDQLIRIDKELDEELKVEMELGLAIEHKNTKIALEKQKALDSLNVTKNRVMDLKHNRPKIEDLEEEAQYLETEFGRMIDRRNQLKDNAVEFFNNLDAQRTNTITEYAKIMETLATNFRTRTEMLNHNSRARIDYCQNLKKEIEGMLSEGEKCKVPKQDHSK